MKEPLVTVICLCYNQAAFVEQALRSVWAQTYPRVQLIMVDDASDDNSRHVIEEMISDDPSIAFVPLTENLGHCQAFNRGLALARGDYVIDLAADDVLMPERIRRGVEALETAGDHYGVNFTDALWINEDGAELYLHSDRFPHDTIPVGDVYTEVVERFFICSPTTLFRRSVIEALGGYDESLLYEDFDFWVRSARNWRYCYTPEVLVKKRVVKNSMSQRQFSVLSPQLKSTYRVCEKIMDLNRSSDEQRALAARIRYEMTVCFRLSDIPLFFRYLRLYIRNSRMTYR